jgi:predicted DNA-binding protein with PD1-like motif
LKKKSRQDALAMRLDEDTDAVNSMLAFFERKRWKILWTHGTGESFTNWT